MKEKSTLFGIEISNPDRIVYKNQQIKKIDVANYYQAVSEKMLPFLQKRLLSVVRCHNGTSNSCFYKKHPNVEFDGMKIVDIENSDEKDDDYFYISNKKGLINEVQFGTIEFHLWGCQVDKIDSPDMMVFDLDPDEKLGLVELRQGVVDLKQILNKLNLKSFLKTSGGKGYHVVVPFSSCINWESFSEFSKRVGQVMEGKWPKLYTTNIRKKERNGKIFIDYLRNTKGATSVAPYSLRARENCSVSMPIEWSQLNNIEPASINIEKAIKLIKNADPWKDFFKVKQTLL